MPVTAKLSKLFYDRLGEEIADELVNWFNQVDATYRGELRETIELNFARLEAKLEARLSTFEARVNERFATLEARVNERFAQLETKLERRLGEQTRWFFLAWATLLITIVGFSLRR